MIEGPLGGAAFNNEFGRPNLLRLLPRVRADRGAAACAARLSQAHHDRGRPGHDRRRRRRTRSQFPAGTLLIQLGGPGMRIGMGGSAASSMATGANAAELDFDSVQRGNPEIERRAQEVINHCWALGDANPILAIHDVGAGGISNAFPELVNDAGRGARFDLRTVPLEETGLAPKEIWCNESQERYVLAIAPRVAAACSRRSASASAARSRWSASRPTRTQLVLEDGAERRRSADRHADGRAARQAAEDASRREDASRARCQPLDLTGVTLQTGRVRRAAPPDRRVQALPHHHRRPHRGRPDPPRPDGRPVAGAGGRLRRDAGRLQRLRAARR